MADLPSRYRPRLFGEVRGQDSIVSYLSQLIRLGQHGEHILFEGAYGSGKTTLARLYAKALNCESPDHTTGSPCSCCSSCKLMDAGTHPLYWEHDGGLQSGKDDIDKIVQPRAIAGPAGYRWRILFIDEVQSLDRSARAALLKLIEDALPTTIFLLATTDASSLSDALRSRLAELRVRQLGGEESIRLLKSVATKEGYPYEESALMLLAGLKGGHARDLLRGLGQVAALGHISRENVLRAFGQDEIPYLLRYLGTLSSDNLHQQAEAFQHWPEAIERKVELTRLAILSIYYDGVLNMPVLFSPLISALTASEREGVIAGFDAKANRAGLEARNFWRRMVEEISRVPSSHDEARLLLAVTLFHDRLNRLQEAEAASSMGLSLHRAERRTARTGRRRAPRTKARDGRLLSLERVGEILDTSSYLIQEHRKTFTFQMVVSHSLVTCTTPPNILMSEFCRNAEVRLRRWTEPLRLLCREELAEGEVSRFVAHVPTTELIEFGSWAERWLVDTRGAQFEKGGFNIDALRPPAYHSRKGQSSFHWKCVRDLCASADPACRDVDSAGNEIWMLDILKLRPAQHRTPLRRLPQGLTASKALQPKTIKDRAQQSRMPFLSAFREKTFSRLFDGWEFKEHEDRRRFEASQKQERAKLEATFSDGTAQGRREREQALESWEAAWIKRSQRSVHLTWPKSE